MPQLKPYTFEDARDLIRDAISRSEARHARWRKLEALYATGSVETAETASEPGKLDLYGLPLDQHVVNMVLPHLNVMRASVVARDPRFVADPIAGGEQAEVNAKIAEGVVHYFWKRARATGKLQRATDDLLRLGNGFLKVAWAREDGDDEVRDPDDILEEVADRVAADAMLSEMEGDDPLDFDDVVDQVELTHGTVERDEPFVEYVSPYDVFVSPNAQSIEEARWVAHRISLPADEVLANYAYDVDEDTLILDGTDTTPGNLTVAEWKRRVEQGDGEYTEALQTATIFEFYDMRAHRLVVLQEGGDAPLYDDELYWSHRYPPLVHLRGYSANGNDFWGFGDLENLASVQSIFNELVTEQIENVRRSGAKYFVDEGVASMSPELIEALESDEPDVVARIDTQGRPMNEVIQAFMRVPTPNDLYQAKAEFQEHLRAILGINDFQAGGVGADRMSATAAAVVDGVASLRAQDKIQAVEEAAAQTAQLLLLLCQEFLEEGTAVRVSGVAGAAWIRPSARDLYGEFLVQVEGGSTKAVNPATREQRAMQALRDVAPVIQGLGFDPVPLVRSAIRDLGFDPEIVMVPAPQPEVPPETAEQGPAADVAGAASMPAMAQTSGEVFL